MPDLGGFRYAEVKDKALEVKALRVALRRAERSA